MKRSIVKFAAAITSMVIIISMITVMPVLARVAQETITVNFNNIRIAVNGQLAQTEFEPFIFQGRTYLPVRDVANAMGYGVTWEDATNTVHLTVGAANPSQFTPAIGSVRQQTITVNFNSIIIAVNNQHVQTEFEPFIFQGRTYLPVRDVADAMGFDVTWEDATNTVHMTSRNSNVAPNYPPHQPVIPVPPIGEIGNITIPANITPRPPATSSTRDNRPSNPAISLQRAIEIAEADLARRGINATFRRDSGMSWERGQWVWELEFRTQGERMPIIEYYINVDNGNIAKFEWDD